MSRENIPEKLIEKLSSYTPLPCLSMESKAIDDRSDGGRGSAKIENKTCASAYRKAGKKSSRNDIEGWNVERLEDDLSDLLSD